VRRCIGAILVSGSLLAVAPTGATAQTDEIQVYDGALTAVGKFNLTWHNNFTPKGVAVCAFPGAVVADRSLNGVTEWALGVTRWFEAGLYFPQYTYDQNLGATFDGFKLRTLFAVPGAENRRFFYGANFEFSVNQKAWDPNRFSSEIRPIIGWHLKPWDVIVNPILDTEYDGVKNLDFAPAVRLAYNVSEAWALSAESYSDFGPLRRLGGAEQSHMLYGVVNHVMPFLEVETGIGFGLTSTGDKLTLKLLLIKDL